MLAWYKTNSNDFVQSVGMRRPNEFKVYDMLGNVWDWCEELSHSNYAGAPVDGSPWSTNGDGNSRVMRGGSFFTRNVDYLRCAARGQETADHSDFETGFRLVAVPRTQ